MNETSRNLLQMIHSKIAAFTDICMATPDAADWTKRDPRNEVENRLQFWPHTHRNRIKLTFCKRK